MKKRGFIGELDGSRLSAPAKCQSSRWLPGLMILCIIAMIQVGYSDTAYSITNDGYPGTTIPGRPSVAMESGPGGIQVNTYNANLFLSRTDLVIPGRGLPIEIEMAYNSMTQTIDSPYGRRWQFNYNIQYMIMPNSDAMILWGDGRTDLFKQSGGNYTPVNEGVYMTLEEYDTGKFRLISKKQIVYYFDDPAHKKLTKIEDPNGNSLTFDYNANNLMDEITDPSGRILTFSYDTNNRLKQITDPDSRILEYNYDASGNMIKITDPTGNVTAYGYDGNSLLTGITDPNGNKITITYDPYLRPYTISTLLSRKSFTWNTLSRTTTVTDKIDDTTTASTQYVYGSNRRLIRIVDAKGGVVEKTYKADGNIQSITDANGITTEYTYDTGGNMFSRTEAVGEPDERTTDYNYDPIYNKIISMTDPLGRTSNYTYDPDGNMLSMTEAVGEPEEMTTYYTYDPNGNMISITEAVGKPEERATIYDYDIDGNNTKETIDPTGLDIKTEYTYDSVGNRLTEKDPNLNTTTYEYDSLNRLITITDALAKITEYTYDSVGNRLTEKDSNLNTTNYEYDSLNRLITITDALVGVSNYTYDANGNKTEHYDANWNKTSYEYDSLNRLVKITDALSNATNYEYDSVGNRISETDANGKKTRYEYDSLNRLVKITDALSNKTNYEYDPLNRIVKITDALSNETSYEYDSLNRLIRITDALSNKTDYEYDSLGNRLSVTDPNTNTTTYTYDAVDRLITETNPESETTIYTYDAAGNRKTVTTPNGNVTTYSYDALNRLVTVTDTLGLIADYEYDPVGNRKSETDANSNKTEYEYDSLNRLIKIKDALSNETNYEYDPVGNRISETDANSNKTSYEYDSLNRLVKITDALSNETNYEYDPVGNRISETDAKGNITDYEYDSLNRLIKETFADTTTKEYEYDPVGNIVTRKDNNGDSTTYIYDAVYRLTKREYPGSNDDEYTYDAAGRMATASNSNAIISYLYDGANRTLDEILNGKTTLYTYNAAAGIRTVTYPGGRAIEENLDLRYFLDTVEEGLSVIADYTYDAGDRMTGRSYFNGTASGFTYDTVDRVTDITHNPGAFVDFNYDFDGVGNRLYEEKVHSPANSEHYTYDNIYRLFRYKEGTLTGGDIPVPITQTQYNYDGVGNRITTNEDGTVTTYASNNMNEYSSIVDGGTINPVHDANGNLTFDGINTYTYDYENRLISVNGGVIATYEYDPLGRRIQKTAGGTTTNYYFDGSRVIEERDGTDAVVSTYVYGSWIDEVLTMDRFGSTYYYHQNSLGSVVAVSDSGGAVVERYEYDAYGNVSIYDGLYAPLGSSAIDNPYMFTGRRLDPETGMYYYRARHYDPLYGRFIQRDPLGYVDGMNLYEYVRGNPVNWVDPAGLSNIDKLDKSVMKDPKDMTIEDIRNIVELLELTGRKNQIKNKLEKKLEHIDDQNLLTEEQNVVRKDNLLKDMRNLIAKIGECNLKTLLKQLNKPEAKKPKKKAIKPKKKAQKKQLQPKAKKPKKQVPKAKAPQLKPWKPFSDIDEDIRKLEKEIKEFEIELQNEERLDSLRHIYNQSVFYRNLHRKASLLVPLFLIVF